MTLDTAPLEGYDRLGAREVMRLILDLSRDALLRVQTYEQRHLRRTQVLGAIRRALARLDTPLPADAARQDPARSR